MNPSDYSPEQKIDIEMRVEKAKLVLKDLHLQPAAFVSPSNIGDDRFALKVVGFLQDTKYTSPMQRKDLSV